MSQACLTEFTQNSRDWPEIGRDEWGPTMRRPVPLPDCVPIENYVATDPDTALEPADLDPWGPWYARDGPVTVARVSDDGAPPPWHVDDIEWNCRDDMTEAERVAFERDQELQGGR